ncbi:SIS domain-containing protein [Candidatus Woesearchaeota archaeon]|nr:SIS domain-containing protein [Candidatus Woesearchaeota archaeon]
MIAKAKAPVRISFGTCGDTDYYVDLIGWGNGINATINLYSYCEIHKRNDNLIVLRSLETGNVVQYNSPDEIELDSRELNMMKAVAKHYGNAGIEVITHTDAPLESGLGGSAAHAISMIRAYDQLNDIQRTQEETAKLAYKIERTVLGIEGGYQDQWAASYGGINYMEFTRDGIKLNAIELGSKDLEFLENSLLLVFVPRQKDGSVVHFEQRKKGQESVHILTMKRDNIQNLKSAFESKNFAEIGNALHFDWKIKKQLAPDISNQKIDEMYAAALAAGAAGGRFIGAGAGGSAIFFCPDKKHEVLNALEKLGAKEIKFKLERRHREYLKNKLDLHRKMVDSIDFGTIEEVSEAVVKCYKSDKKLIIFGNGGSAADAMHFATEFEGQLSAYDKGRKPLSALVPFNISALTAMSNDYNYDTSFLRFVTANANENDLVIGISTSGNSRNVIEAIKAAKEKGSTTAGFTGNDGGELGKIVDIHLNIPVSNVSIIQEGHIIAYHRICAIVLKELFGYDPMR